MQTKSFSYWRVIGETAQSLWAGLRLTFRHLLKARNSRKHLPIISKGYFDQPEGIVTVQYPYEMQPIPDNGRYRLHNEIDDCIVCDKCAKICPVDCITIEPIKAVEEIGKTSDGTSKRIYAAKFDIDMGKCCFCGLCTTVCPTECLTMTKVYDYSVFDVKEHNFVFGEMTPAEIVQKRMELEEYQKTKASTVAATSANTLTTTPSAVNSVIETKTEPTETPKTAKPVFRPKIKPTGTPPTA